MNRIHYLILGFIFLFLINAQDCGAFDEGDTDSCFDISSSYYSATKSNLYLNELDSIRFEWYQCTEGGLYKLYIWEDSEGFPGEDLFSELQLEDYKAGWNYSIIPTNNFLNNNSLWIGLREYTATQSMGLIEDSMGCSLVENGSGWQQVNEGNLAYRITTCLQDNPAGCFATGCDEGYVCLDSEYDCMSSECMCDESQGEWMCSSDCNGGVCYLSGCMDPNACNYNIDAEVSDNSCAYEIDCAGVCGGEAIEDVCGICAGNTTSFEECMGYYCNLELVSYLGFGQGLSDITGFYQDGREFAVVGLVEDAAVFVDITDPYNPQEISRIPGTPSTWRDIKYWNRHIYIGTEAPDGVKVVSVDNPDNPIWINTITDFTNSHNIHIDPEGYLYVVGADEYDIWIYELTDHPENPILVGNWIGEYLHDIEVYNNKLYGAAIYSGQFYILDVSDKSNPTTILSHYTGGIMTHDCAVTYDENYLLTADETSGGHVKLWDISNYDNINLLSEYLTSLDHSVHNIYIRPETDLVIMSYYVDGTRVIDISDPQDPIEVGYFDTSDYTGLYDGNWGTYAYLPSGYIISSDRANGLFIFASPLTNPDLNWNNCNLVLGDVNLDNSLNILDIVTIVNFILGVETFSNDQLNLADSNNDSSIDILDIIEFINIILYE